MRWKGVEFLKHKVKDNIHQFEIISLISCTKRKFTLVFLFYKLDKYYLVCYLEWYLKYCCVFEEN